jgi:hypothetical protein
MSHIPNLEHDLYQSESIRSKAAGNEIYCHNLYAALCNNEFQKLAVEPILTDERWGCTWRYAGGIASRLFNDMNSDDYLQFYCAGMGSYSYDNIRVAEGMVTDEIRADLLSLDWVLIDNPYHNLV